MPPNDLITDGLRNADAKTEGRAAALVRFRSFITRHRVTVQDLSVLLAILLVATFLAFEFDIYANQDGVTKHEQTVELDEALTLEQYSASVCWSSPSDVIWSRNARRAAVSPRSSMPASWPSRTR